MDGSCQCRAGYSYCSCMNDAVCDPVTGQVSSCQTDELTHSADCLSVCVGLAGGASSVRWGIWRGSTAMIVPRTVSVTMGLSATLSPGKWGPVWYEVTLSCDCFSAPVSNWVDWQLLCRSMPGWNVRRELWWEERVCQGEQPPGAGWLCVSVYEGVRSGDRRWEGEAVGSINSQTLFLEVNIMLDPFRC